MSANDRLRQLLRRAARAFVRAVAKTLGAFVPLRMRTSSRLYRRAAGGRWSRSIDGTRWRPREMCPGALYSEVLGGEPVPSGVCFDNTQTGIEYHGGDPFEDNASECHCEVWP